MTDTFRLSSGGLKNLLNCQIQTWHMYFISRNIYDKKVLRASDYR